MINDRQKEMGTYSPGQQERQDRQDRDLPHDFQSQSQSHTIY